MYNITKNLVAQDLVFFLNGKPKQWKIRANILRDPPWKKSYLRPWRIAPVSLISVLYNRAFVNKYTQLKKWPILINGRKLYWRFLFKTNSHGSDAKKCRSIGSGSVSLTVKLPIAVLLFCSVEWVKGISFSSIIWVHIIIQWKLANIVLLVLTGIYLYYGG